MRIQQKGWAYSLVRGLSPEVCEPLHVTDADTHKVGLELHDLTIGYRLVHVESAPLCQLGDTLGAGHGELGLANGLNVRRNRILGLGCARPDAANALISLQK